MTDLPPPVPPATETNPSGADAPPPPSPALPPMAGPTAPGPGRWRLFLILGGIAVFFVAVLWVIRNNQSIDDLAIGTCFDVPAGSSGLSTVTRHDCAEAHDAEVFHVVEYTDGSTYPISLSLDSFIDSSCVPAFASYVGQDFDLAETLDIGFFYPSRDGWDTGDRTITCYLLRVDDAKLTRSMKDSGGA